MDMFRYEESITYIFGKAQEPGRANESLPIGEVGISPRATASASRARFCYIIEDVACTCHLQTPAAYHTFRACNVMQLLLYPAVAEHLSGEWLQAMTNGGS